ncbi:hypothetical protein S245_036899, partial [Arachis hypogaea]
HCSASILYHNCLLDHHSLQLRCSVATFKLLICSSCHCHYLVSLQVGEALESLLQ